MPARTTPFQRLVHHLQTQLSQGHEVVESAMLRHRLTGDEREVDVVIRSSVGEHPIVVSVECIDHARPADSTWVEQMKAKHEHLETNRLVLVSRSGFYQSAIRTADAMGIATYTPEEACTADWTTIVGKGPVFVARYDFTPTFQWLRVLTPTGSQYLEAGDPTLLQLADGAAAGTLGEFISSLLHGRMFAGPAMDGLKEDTTTTLQVDCNVDDEVYAVDNNGVRQRFDGLRIKVRAVRRTSYLELSAITWNGTPAAFGHDKTVLGDTTVTVIEQEPGNIDTQVIVDGRRLGIVQAWRHRSYDNTRVAQAPLAVCRTSLLKSGGRTSPGRCAIVLSRTS